MRPEMQRLAASAIIPALLVFALYALKALETGMGWDFTSWGVRPLEWRGVAGIVLHPLVHADWEHLAANTLPLFFLSWCLFYFYRHIASYIFFTIWIGCGIITFLIGKPGWHVGASGIIYGLAFFLFFSGILRKHVPLVAISLLITFLYGGLVWSMFPQFAKSTTSWEGHLGGAIAGTICAAAFRRYGPQRPEPFAEEEEENDAPESTVDAPVPDNGIQAEEQSKELSPEDDILAEKSIHGKEADST